MSLHSNPIIYFIYGDEPYQKQQSLDNFRAKIKKAGYTQRETFEIERSSNLSLLQNAINQLSLFIAKRCLEIHLIETTLNKTTATEFIQIIGSSYSDLCLLVVLGKPSAKTQKANWFIKLQQCATEEIKAYPLSNPQLINWIKHKIKKHNIILSQNSVQTLVDKTQGNLLLTAQTLDKIVLLYPNQIIHDNTLDAILFDNPKFSIFDLTNSLLEGNFEKTFSILETLISMGISYTLIIWSITRETRFLLKIIFQKEQNKLSNTHLFTQFHVWQKQQPRYQLALNRLSSNILEKSLLNLIQLDQISKGAHAYISRNIILEKLQLIILSLCLPSIPQEKAYD